MDLSINIRLLLRLRGARFLVYLLVSRAELPEILTGLRTDVIKQLYDDLLWLRHASELVVHVHVAAAWRLIDCLTLRILCCLAVYQNACFVRVTEVAESPL